MRRIALLLLAAVALLPLSLPAQEYGKAGRQLTNAGVPVNGTNAVHTLTFGGTPTGGTFKLTLNGETTAAISWSSTNGTLVSNIDTALEALPSVGAGGVVTAVGTMTAGIGTITVTFSGTNVAKRPIPVMTVTSSLTGTAPTLTDSAATTAGVTPTGGGGTELGAMLTDTTNGNTYMNNVAPPNVNWLPFHKGKSGSATLVAGTVTVADTAVTANTRIFVGYHGPLGTVTTPKALGVTARTAGTSFVITSADATDTSVVDYVEVEP